jgi:hypothetical protein
MLCLYGVCWQEAQDGLAAGPGSGFKREVSETFLRCKKLGFDQNNVVIELNGLKIAEDKTFADCARYIFTTMLGAQRSTSNDGTCPPSCVVIMVTKWGWLYRITWLFRIIFLSRHRGGGRETSCPPGVCLLSSRRFPESVLGTQACACRRRLLRALSTDRCTPMPR